MNGLKLIHTDILIIMIDDVNQRAKAGELSDTEYTVQISPLNSELYDRAIALYNDDVARDKHYRSLSEIKELEAANNVRQIYASFIEYKSKTDRTIQEYEDFLEDKQFDDEFIVWHDERIQKKMNAAASKSDDSTAL